VLAPGIGGAFGRFSATGLVVAADSLASRRPSDLVPNRRSIVSLGGGHLLGGEEAVVRPVGDIERRPQPDPDLVAEAVTARQLTPTSPDADNDGHRVHRRPAATQGSEAFAPQLAPLEVINQTNRNLRPAHRRHIDGSSPWSPRFIENGPQMSGPVKIVEMGARWQKRRQQSSLFKP